MEPISALSAEDLVVLLLVSAILGACATIVSHAVSQPAPPTTSEPATPSLCTNVCEKANNTWKAHGACLFLFLTAIYSVVSFFLIINLASALFAKRWEPNPNFFWEYEEAPFGVRVLFLFARAASAVLLIGVVVGGLFCMMYSVSCYAKMTGELPFRRDLDDDGDLNDLLGSSWPQLGRQQQQQQQQASEQQVGGLRSGGRGRGVGR